MLHSRQEARGLDEAASRLSEVRTVLSALADVLVQIGTDGSAGRSAEEADDLIGQMDAVAIESRRSESLMVRLIADLDRETGAVVDPLHDLPPEGRQDRLLRIFGIGRKLDEPEARDRRAAVVIRRILVDTHAMLACLEDHRGFLLDLLNRCEPPIDAALSRLRRTGTFEDDLPLRDELTRGIDMLQDFVDRIIDMLSAFNLLVNKLALDAEERVLSLRGLASDTLLDTASDAPRLATLLMRADRGLLTVHGLAGRKARLDDAFRRRLSSSRQAGHR
ncbi:hypothetical protein AAIH46_03620 [Rhizobium sp. 0TCS1.26]|uniref:hypothetical protein n=1 Tax=Rhizobium sp. 0TCS1.26 TaxID=3142623 RepID=UPI003D26AED2